jgi:hypothetical protein
MHMRMSRDTELSEIFCLCLRPFQVHIHSLLSPTSFWVVECAFAMASFEIATGADLASVLPGLVIALHLQQEQTIPTVSKSFHDGATLPTKEAIQMTCGDGKTLSGKAIVRYFAELASRSDSNTSHQASSVRIKSRGPEDLLNIRE